LNLQIRLGATLNLRLTYALAWSRTWLKPSIFRPDVVAPTCLHLQLLKLTLTVTHHDQVQQFHFNSI